MEPENAEVMKCSFIIHQYVSANICTFFSFVMRNEIGILDNEITFLHNFKIDKEMR